MNNVDWYQNAINAIDNVTSHPSAALFCKPIDDKAEGNKDYYTVIGTPRDFGFIKKKLRNKEYKSIQQVTNDVEQIWKNAVTFNGEKNEVATLAHYCFDIFQKQLRENDLLQVNAWCSEVFRFRTKITELMSNLPSKVRQFSSSLNAGKSLKQNTPVLSERDLHNFISASEKLQTDEDHKEMIRILNENQPELDVGNTEIHLEVTRLTHQTISALKKYMSDALAKKGVSYPE